jgi:hypothetical protein
MYAKKHVMQWLEEDYPAVQHRAFHCIQEPGDIIFVPDGWSHAVQNLAESVGYAFLFDLTVKKKRPFIPTHSTAAAGGGGRGKGGGAGARGGGSTDYDALVATFGRAELSKQRIKKLRGMLSELYQQTCDDCVSKDDFVDTILALQAAAKARTAAAGAKGKGSGTVEL